MAPSAGLCLINDPLYFDCQVYRLVPQIDPSVPQLVVQSRRRPSTWAISWLKAPTSAFTFKTLLRHYANPALTPR